MKYRRTGFSLLRWSLFIFILLLLGLIATIAFQWNQVNTRDTERLWDIAVIKATLDQITEKWWNLPLPSENSEIHYKGGLLWTQWIFWEAVWTWGIVPDDPLYWNKYTYSVNNFRSKYELSSVYENWDIEGFSLLSWKGTHTAMVQWTYNGKFLKTSVLWTDYILALPSITASSLDDTNISTILSDKNLVYEGQGNIPSSYKGLWYSMNGKVDYSNSDPVVFKWKFSSLKRWGEQLLFWVALKKAYENTFLETLDSFKELEQIDGTNKKRESVQVVLDYICNDIWGLWELLSIKDCK